MKSSLSLVALLSLSGISSVAQAGILDWFGRMQGQETLEPHAGNHVIREEIVFTGDVGRARSYVTQIYNMSEWSPLTNFRGETDVGKLPVASITTSAGTEEINLIITERTYTDNASTICGRSTGLLYNQQFCRRLFIQDNGEMVYETEILFDGVGILKAKREEDEIRAALQAEVEGFAEYVETAHARNEQSKINNKRTDDLNKILREMQDAEQDAEYALDDVINHQHEAKRLRQVAAEFAASSHPDQLATAPLRLEQAKEQDQKALAKQKKAADLKAKAAELKAQLRARGLKI